MTKKYFLILPNQLFEDKYLNKEYNYIIWEHPHYFKSYNYNKKKLILHFSSMKYYYDYLTQKKFKVEYISFYEKFTINKYTLFDPIDNLDLPNEYEIIDSPNFLLSTELLDEYRKKTDKFFFNSFYMINKKKLNILPDVKSKDKENRKKIPQNEKIPELSNNKSDSKYINYGIKRVEKFFPKNIGNTDNFIFPVTHNTAKKWLNDFIEKKIKKFGDYQDSIVKENNTLFHSILSSSINISLINPLFIVQELEKYKRKIPLNSYEGYVRQLFWREYQRYCYKFCDFNKNYFGNKNKLSKKWWTGELGIEPVDDCIKKAFDTGYLHHIERLMIIGNFMNLSEISPTEGYKWFMEFACDSYDWVMHQNVYDMVFFVTGGKTMKRPYMSSSNYILKMSNYKKGEWCDIWTNLYRNFIEKNKKKLEKYRYYYKI